MKNLIYLLLVLFVCSCSSNVETIIEDLSTDEANRYLVENLSIADNGLYQLNVSEDEALKQGVSKIDYQNALDQMQSINELIFEAQIRGDSIIYAESEYKDADSPKTRAEDMYCTVDGPKTVYFETAIHGSIQISAGSTQFLWGLNIDSNGNTYFISGNLYQRKMISVQGGPNWRVSFSKAVDSAAPIYVTIHLGGVMLNGVYYPNGSAFDVVVDGEIKTAYVIDGQIIIMQ